MARPPSHIITNTPLYIVQSMYRPAHRRQHHAPSLPAPGRTERRPCRVNTIPACTLPNRQQRLSRANPESVLNRDQRGRGRGATPASVCETTLRLLWFRDRPKPISLVSAVAETVAETRDTYTAVTEP